MKIILGYCGILIFVSVLLASSMQNVSAQLPFQSIPVQGCGVINGPITQNTIFVDLASFKNVGDIKLSVTPDHGLSSTCTMTLTSNLKAMLEFLESKGLKPDQLGSYTIRIPFTFYQHPGAFGGNKACLSQNDLNSPICEYTDYDPLTHNYHGLIDLR